MTRVTSLDLDVAPSSVVVGDEAQFALAGRGPGHRLVVVAPADAAWLDAFEGEVARRGDEAVLTGPLSERNAAALRGRLEWLRPVLLGLRTSAGFGDRLGLATPGHIRALRAVEAGRTGASSIAPIFAQQSIREMSRTARTPQQVVDEAMWGVFSEGWHGGFGADADHLKQPEHVDDCLAAGFTFFTVDPGDHVEASAERLGDVELRDAFERLPWQQLEDEPAAFGGRYAGRAFDADGHRVSMDTRAAVVAAVKYGRAVAHVVLMFRHLLERAGAGQFELEVSLDETERPTSHAEHVYVASELKRLGVSWVSLAPRFVGRFEKGVDYIGDQRQFQADVGVHAAIARAFGPYKLSLHSGSDKFGIYGAVAAATRGLVHVKTAGTSYLEALRTVALADPGLFREIYAYARERYETDRATYHVSATLDRAPEAGAGQPDALVKLLDDFHARQVLHVTFGSVLTVKDNTGAPRFAERLMAVLRANEDAYAQNLERHFRRHLEPFAV